MGNSINLNMFLWEILEMNMFYGKFYTAINIFYGKFYKWSIFTWPCLILFDCRVVRNSAELSPNMSDRRAHFRRKGRYVMMMSRLRQGRARWGRRFRHNMGLWVSNSLAPMHCQSWIPTAKYNLCFSWFG
jgi:hypothetical protein